MSRHLALPIQSGLRRSETPADVSHVLLNVTNLDNLLPTDHAFLQRIKGDNRSVGRRQTSGAVASSPRVRDGGAGHDCI